MQLMQAGENQVTVSITLEQAQIVARCDMQGLAPPHRTTHDKAILLQYGIATDALLKNRSVIFALEPVLGSPVTLDDKRIQEPPTSET